MGLILNNNNINKLYYGGSEVSKAYLGTTQVYPNQTTIQYIPNPNMTIFPNYETRTIERGRYLNVEGTDLTADDYPLFSFGEYNPTEGGTLFLRMYGQITTTSYSDWRNWYDLDYFTFFDGESSTRNIQLQHLSNDTFPLTCNVGNTELSLTAGQFFCVDLMPNDQGLTSTIPKLRLCDEDGIITYTASGTNFGSGTLSTDDQFVYGAYPNAYSYGCPATKLKLDLVKSGVYFIAGDGTYLRDNPNEAILFENRSIMIQNGG